MIKAAIIDDEKASRDTLKSLLSIYVPDVEVVGFADGVESGIQLIKEQKPELVFLDIQMPDGSGFKLLEEFENFDFRVIFTTAFDQYAIKAIKFSALDYLLKPIAPEDLTEAVEKYKKNISKDTQIKTLLKNINTNKKEEQSIIVYTSEGMHVIKIDNIIRCQSDDYYTRYFLKENKTLMVSKTLKETEELLSEYNFVRCHKSHLVNAKFIKSFLKVDGGTIVTTDGTKIPVSRRKREHVMNYISNL